MKTLQRNRDWGKLSHFIFKIPKILVNSECQKKSLQIIRNDNLQIIRNDNLYIKCPNDGLFNENVLFHKNLRYKCS